MEPEIESDNGRSQEFWDDLFLKHGRGLMVIISWRMPPVLERFCSKEDVLQEVFLRAFERREELTEPEGGGTFRFLRKIAYYVLKELTRSAVLRRVQGLHGSDGMISTREGFDAWLVASVTRASVRLMHDESVRRMIDILERLDQKDAEIILMFYLDVLTHREIAERLDVSEAVARQRLHRAMERMRKIRDELDETKGPVLLPHERDG